MSDCVDREAVLAILSNIMLGRAELASAVRALPAVEPSFSFDPRKRHAAKVAGTEVERFNQEQRDDR